MLLSIDNKKSAAVSSPGKTRKPTCVDEDIVLENNENKSPDCSLNIIKIPKITTSKLRLFTIFVNKILDV